MGCVPSKKKQPTKKVVKNDLSVSEGVTPHNSSEEKVKKNSAKKVLLKKESSGSDYIEDDKPEKSDKSVKSSKQLTIKSSKTVDKQDEKVVVSKTSKSSLKEDDKVVKSKSSKSLNVKEDDKVLKSKSSKSAMKEDEKALKSKSSKSAIKEEKVLVSKSSRKDVKDKDLKSKGSKKIIVINNNNRDDSEASIVENKEEESSGHDFEFKVMMAGKQGVGKSSILQRYFNNKFKDEEIIEFKDSLKKEIKVRKHNVVLEIFDPLVTDDYKFKPQVLDLYEKVNVIILVFSVMDQFSFKQEMDNWIRDASDLNPNIKFFIVGNKTDMKRDINRATIQKYCESKNIPAPLEVSACDGKGIKNMFIKVSDYLIKNS